MIWSELWVLCGPFAFNQALPPEQSHQSIEYAYGAYVSLPTPRWVEHLMQKVCKWSLPSSLAGLIGRRGRWHSSQIVHCQIVTFKAAPAGTDSGTQPVSWPKLQDPHITLAPSCRALSWSNAKRFNQTSHICRVEHQAFLAARLVPGLTIELLLVTASLLLEHPNSCSGLISCVFPAPSEA